MLGWHPCTSARYKTIIAIFAVCVLCVASFQTQLWLGQADITLRGYSGYNTRWALQTLEQNFPVGPGAPTYSFATVWFGANDAALPNRYK